MNHKKKMKTIHDVHQHLYTPLINQINERNCCCCNVQHLTRGRSRLLHRQSLLIGIFMGFAIAVSALCTILSSSSSSGYRLYDADNDDVVGAAVDALMLTNNYKNVDTSSSEFFSEASSSDKDDATTTRFLFDDVRILCMVFTYEDNFASKARLVNETWGKRCSKLLFLANATDTNDTINVTVLNINESRSELWGKTKAAFQLAYHQYLNEYDWFLKADDDTYVILENLRYFLYPYPPDMALYFGYKFKREYMSGGAGYVLSRESVRKFIEEALPDESNCTSGSTGDEDYELGKCLRSVGIPLGDSRDEFGKERFSPLPPQFLLNPDQNKTFWYFTLSYYEERAGLDCCSDSSISFHYVHGVDFYMLEYFVYHLKPIPRLYGRKLPRKYSKEDVNRLLEESGMIENGTES